MDEKETNAKVKILELWGGVECTVNRVGDHYFDQLKSNGHDNRIEDLDIFSKTGLKSLRYPFLWERIAPQGVAQADWTWADQRLARLQELKIRPIVGFLHHGSGPRYTHLLDPGFSEKFLEYARAFAQRYPWVEDYTPINEVLTTARFSGLYGVWYPHKATSQAFFQILIHECRATVRAMEAIRKINPNARLIQTDDLGKASSSPSLQYQADFENERRWLGWDLLCGKVNPNHPLWAVMINNGISPDDLLWFFYHPCPPDIIGINHYPLSNRYLDDKLEAYPTWSHGNNGKNHYADMEAVRVGPAPQITPREIFQEAWERYHLPIAITEVHIDAPREDQVRWFMDIWNSAQELRSQGIQIEAVTAWGLLGHFDWHCLVTRCEGRYESGIFDLRSPQPRPTALVKMMRELANQGTYEHSILSSPGWWRRDSRVRYREEKTSSQLKKAKKESIRPLLITGARGTLGKAFARRCEQRGLPYCLLSRQILDIALPDSVQAAFVKYNPWAVINSAGFVRVDEAEDQEHPCFRENVQGPLSLAQACASRAIPFVTFSSDLVFDGKLSRPYLESDLVNPLNIYGKSKAKAEELVLCAFEDALIVRTSSFFDPWDENNFVMKVFRSLQEGLPFSAASDLRVSPTYVPELVDVTLNLLLDGEKGIWHLANVGEVTWSELALEVAQRLKLDTSLILARKFSEFKKMAPRPIYSVLKSERGTFLKPLDQALTDFIEDCELVRSLNAK